MRFIIEQIILSLYLFVSIIATRRAKNFFRCEKTFLYFKNSWRFVKIQAQF